MRKILIASSVLALAVGVASAQAGGAGAGTLQDGAGPV